ncbi:unnamed protein product [marine sediment metagenome]|uniref:Uncharacterized protein n=1 Tax=marine sediment metagenome TaxID=412755 RepID=X1JBZ9_9ZZZZ
MGDFCLRCSKKHNCPEGRKMLKKIELLRAAFFDRVFNEGGAYCR